MPGGGGKKESELDRPALNHPALTQSCFFCNNLSVCSKHCPRPRPRPRPRPIDKIWISQSSRTHPILLLRTQPLRLLHLLLQTLPQTCDKLDVRPRPIDKIWISGWEVQGDILVLRICWAFSDFFHVRHFPAIVSRRRSSNGPSGGLPEKQLATPLLHSPWPTRLPSLILYIWAPTQYSGSKSPDSWPLESSCSWQTMCPPSPWRMKQWPGDRIGPSSFSLQDIAYTPPSLPLPSYLPITLHSTQLHLLHKGFLMHVSSHNTSIYS